MQNLVHFERFGPGGSRVRIASGPAVGQLTIFSETFIREHAVTQYPGGFVDRPQTWPLPPGTIITLNPDQGAPQTFRVDSIGPYQTPAHGMLVVRATRLT